MKKFLGCFLISSCLFGCASGELEQAEDGDDELVGVADGALVTHNAVFPNAVFPNAVFPNAVFPNAVSLNALTPETIDSSVSGALQDPGEAGFLSRMHVRYLVSCAFDTAHTFEFSWMDDADATHHEVYRGAMALAPDWVTRGITETEQRWISACMGARTNFYGVSVLISMRGSHSSLALGENELADYPVQEGAFVGNIFAPMPYLKACYNTDNVSHSRAKHRDCATGHLDGTSTVECGMIDVVGPCSSLCIGDPQHPENGFTSCDGRSEAITTYLPL